MGSVRYLWFDLLEPHINVLIKIKFGCCLEVLGRVLPVSEQLACPPPPLVALGCVGIQQHRVVAVLDGSIGTLQLQEGTRKVGEGNTSEK